MTGTDVALDHYMQPSRRAAEAAIGGHTGDAPKRTVGSSPEKIKKQRCEGEDLNLHGSYPASTSSQRQFQFIDVFSFIRCTKRHENAKVRTHNRETIRETF